MTEAALGSQRAISALHSSGLLFDITRHGPVRSLAEAAAARGVSPSDLVKTLVVRRGRDDYLFVLVPGGRLICWPKLRAHLQVTRLSMPDATVAREVTGYERGTITPFGAIHPWPVIADETIVGRRISIGAGERGVSALVDSDALIRVLDAQVADVTEALDK